MSDRKAMSTSGDRQGGNWRLEMSRIHALAVVSAFTLMVGAVPSFAGTPPDTPQFNGRESQAQEELNATTDWCSQVMSAPANYGRSEVDYCRDASARY
jgi:hypothetical protein